MFGKWLKKLRGGKRVSSRHADSLDQHLVHLGGKDWWSLRHAVESAIIFGQPGSGKSSGPLAAILAAAFRANVGIVSLAAKPGQADAEEALARKHGREVFRIGKESINVFAELMNPNADHTTNAITLAKAVRTLKSVLSRSKPGGGGDHGEYFVGNEDRLNENTFEAHLLAGQIPSAQGAVEFISSLPHDAEHVRSEGFKHSRCHQVLAAAFVRAKQNGWMADFQRVHNALMVEFVAIPQKTRGTFQAGVYGALNPLTKGQAARTVAAAAPSLKLSDLLLRPAPPVIISEMNYGTDGDTARAVHTLVKLVTHVVLMRRKIESETVPILCLADEIQNIISESDWAFASESRGYRAGSIYATQSINSLFAAYPNEAGRAAVETLLGCLNTKVICLPDYQTAVWASNQLGKELRPFFGGSGGSGGYESPSDLLYGTKSNASASFNMQLTEILRPEELAQLRTGGPRNKYLVECLWLQRGRSFNGYPFTFVTFNQKG